MLDVYALQITRYRSILKFQMQDGTICEAPSTDFVPDDSMDDE